ncbi:MAG: AAA family ATPase [Candidatus Dependentiae bacterium]
MMTQKHSVILVQIFFIYIKLNSAHPEHRLETMLSTINPQNFAVLNTQRQPQIPTLPDHQSLLEQYKAELPSILVATKRINQAINHNPRLISIIKQLQDPDKYKHLTFPSRLLFTGPYGCGKTTGALALARHCNMNCLFIKSTSIGTERLNSGKEFIDNLFNNLISHPENKYIVIIDELLAVARFSHAGSDRQQDLTALTFWNCLDKIKNKRHICVVGTFDKDHDKIDPTIKRRFESNVIHFNPAEVPEIVEIMKDSLNHLPEDLPAAAMPRIFHRCSDDFLRQMASRASHLSIRNIKRLIGKTIALAIDETGDPNAIVEEKHIQEVWNQNNLDRFSRIYNHPLFKSVTTYQVISLCSFLTGIGLRTYGTFKDNEKFESSGNALIAASCIYYLMNEPHTKN